MCGVVGVIGTSEVIPEIADGLLFMQHRGQDAAGTATFDGTTFHLRRAMGLVREVFAGEDLGRFRGHVGIGHVRYPTIGGGGVEDTQPFRVNSPFGIAMAHNGNLTNFKPLREELHTRCRRHIDSSCDVEVILNVFADELERRLSGASPDDPTEAIFDSVGGTFKRCRGSYSVVSIIAGQGLLAFRAPFGIKPLIYGRRRDGDGWRYMFASESCALVSLGYEVVRDVEPGEAILVRAGGKPLSRQVAEAKGHLCIFEFIYFARPDSEIDGISVYKARLRLGEALARRWGERGGEVDTVIPVPDSSRPAAQQMAFELKKPFREGLLKNRYIGRTFITAGNANRRRDIRFKLSPVRLEIEDKRVLLVDDSIVRGNTAEQIIQMVRDTGASEVHMASSCPPLRFPCVYGIDMSTKKEFVAQDRSESEVRDRIGADALLYQRIEDMVSACRPPDETAPRGFCMACMDGNYPTGDVSPEVLAEIEDERVRAAQT
jgi:amidophosphoribosyltransferase